MRNELYYGDNLDVLRRKIASESVDLCYGKAVKAAAAAGDADKQAALDL